MSVYYIQFQNNSPSVSMHKRSGVNECEQSGNTKLKLISLKLLCLHSGSNSGGK